MAYSYQEGFYFKPRIDYAALEKYNEGLILSTACLGGHIPTLLRHNKPEEAEKWIQWGLDVFGKDRFFLELMPTDLDVPGLANSEQGNKQRITNERLIEAGLRLGAHCIVTNDAPLFVRIEITKHMKYCSLFRPST